MSSYDHNLLGEVPKATRAQLQEGYNVDLLERPPRRTPSMHTPPSQAPQTASTTVPLTPAIAETPGEKFGSPASGLSSSSRSKTSFWRTRNGIITVAVIALVVVGAVVGGAVGGTVKNNTSSRAKTETSTTLSSSAPVSQNTATATQGIGAGSPSQSAVTTGTNKIIPTQPAGQNTQSVD